MSECDENGSVDIAGDAFSELFLRRRDRASSHPNKRKAAAPATAPIAIPAFAPVERPVGPGIEVGWADEVDDALDACVDVVLAAIVEVVAADGVGTEVVVAELVAEEVVEVEVELVVEEVLAFTTKNPGLEMESSSSDGSVPDSMNRKTQKGFTASSLLGRVTIHIESPSSLKLI